MKFGLVCDVKSKILINSGQTIHHEGKTFIFYADDENGFLNRIRIISEVTDPNAYFFYKDVDEQAGAITNRIGYEEDVMQSLITELQELESFLAVHGNLKQINWRKVTWEYYPETEEEHARFQIIPPWFFLHELKSDEPTILPPDQLRMIVQQKKGYDSMIVPMAFYREGKNEYGEAKYINSFFNYYFIFEGLYGSGKTKNDAIEQEFKKSKDFRGFVENLIKQFDEGENGAKEQLVALLKNRNQSYTVDGIIRLIIKMRGELHHYIHQSSKLQGTPFNHADFKIIALVAHHLAGQSVVRQIEEIAKMKEE